MNAPQPIGALRRRRLWFGIGLIATGLFLTLLALLYWLLQTTSGRDALLAQVVTRLPAATALTWDRAEGAVAGPLTLHNIEFRYQDIHFRAARLRMDPDIWRLLLLRLRLDVLEMSNASLSLGQSEEPFKLPSWPDVLPSINVPLALQIDTITIDNFRISKLKQPLIHLRRIRGAVNVADGELKIQRLAVDSDRGNIRADGYYRPRHDYSTDLTATAVLPSVRGRPPASFGLVIRGDLDRLQLALAGRAPAPLQADVVLNGRSDPRWTFSAASEHFEPGLLLPGELTGTPSATALAFNVHAQGQGGKADLKGQFKQGEQTIVLQPSRLQLANQMLMVEPLVIDAFGGRTNLRGKVDLRDPANTRFHFSVNARGLSFKPAPEPGNTQVRAVPVVLEEAGLGVSGTLRAWAAVGRARLTRDAQQARLIFDVRGDAEHATFKQVQAATPGGLLDFTGGVTWAPALRWDLKAELAQFDPGYFIPGWNGHVSGQLTSQGRQRTVSSGIEAIVAVPGLNGQLRQRPMQASGRFTLKDHQGEGAFQIGIGDSHISAKGKVGPHLDLAVQLQSLHLNDLLPSKEGTLKGSLLLKGPAHTPDVIVDLNGTSLRWNDYRAKQFALHGHLPWRGNNGKLTLQAQELEIGTLLDSVRIHASGAVENLNLQADVRHAMVLLTLHGGVHRDGARWRGNLSQLRIEPAKGPAWALRAPAQFVMNAPAFTLSATCLDAQGGGALCLHADWPHEGLVLKGQALPLTLVHPWLPKKNGRSINLRGVLTLDGHLRPHGDAWEGSFRASSLEGGIRLGEPRYADVLGVQDRGELVRYDQFSVQVDLTSQHIVGKLGIGFQGNGFVDAKFNTGWDPYAPLTGDLYMNMSRLYWLEMFVPDIGNPRGLIEGHVSLRGTRSGPLLGGEATLRDFTAEYPSIGLNLSQGQGRFTAQPDGSARILASVKSGDGTLNIDGGLSWFGENNPLQLNIRGRNVLAYNTSELRIVSDPDLRFGLINNTMQLQGEVAVSEADIDLERLDRGVSVSEDVVVLDPIDPERTTVSPLEMNLRIVLGDKVNMSGFGLKGGLSGQMQIRARPGREMTANGGLDVRGRYKAYGQDLTITRGQLVWNNNIVSDPRVNIRAQRRIADITAGIDVSGRAQSPRAQVWSDPVMSQSEALSYLVLGRKLATASSDENQQVASAAAALSAGGGLIASQLGAKLGLDDAGISQSSTMGGSVLGFGKYLSPKLYVGYGVSMVGSGSVLTLKYLLSRGFDLEVESSTVETKGSVNWRKEK
ncbi:translocation/assembly module TamB domain-containing protein [Xylella fastidiosa subsp. sandyi]|uniref:translocation/assembly module TamB domain-containing protein n=1 Tax=Xylella fastidiosa TaxID=2371 RepID=UPI00070850B5|nr:translocation/assembly module TamB domain-containing protein [Xylella fastidiosa]KQH72978.1 pathogenicity protein [Xylella fastidiosa]RWA43748.1 translocation/assembly module TamB [Xylella fastidiosa subsp. sandyi]WNY19546.1 translocation/assembly module TamB domain-containing protein [Xylella fastidiosa]WNY21839.1 translocation/assembly module TamB domain-containing protein [Xylella fastidiosa]